MITSLCDCILHILDGVREAIKSFVGAQKSRGWHDTYHMKLCDLRSCFDAKCCLWNAVLNTPLLVVRSVASVLVGGLLCSLHVTVNLCFVALS